MRLRSRSFSLDASDEGLEAPEDVRFDAVADPRAVDLAADEPRVLEHLQVLRHGGLGERQLVDDVAADARVSAYEEPEYLHARGVANRFAEERELLVCRWPLDRAEVRFLL